MIIDRAKSSLENFRALVKAANPSANLNDLNSVTGTPTAGSYVNGNNTMVALSAIKNKGLSGTREVYYKRATLVEGLLSPISSINLLQGETAAAVGQRIFQALNILPTEVTVNNGAGFTASGQQTIRSNANSFCYLPNQSITVNVVAQSFAASYEITCGVYSAIPFKQSTRHNRWGAGIVGKIMVAELDTAHSQAVGTMFGSFQKNPGDNLIGFMNMRDPGTAETWNLTVKKTMANPPAIGSNVKFTNLLTGQSVTVKATNGMNSPDFPNGIYYWGQNFTFSMIGLSESGGGRLGIDFL